MARVASAAAADAPTTAERRRFRLPSRPASSPVHVTSALVVYVALLAVASVALAVVLPYTTTLDVATLTIGAIAACAMEATAITTTQRVNVHWSATGYVHLMMSVVLGPAGCAVSALAGLAGVAGRYRNGVLRITFNGANYYLSNVAAWATFIAVNHRGSLVWGGIAGVAAGVCRSVVNLGLLGAVIRMSDPSVNLLRWVRGTVIFIPYGVGYGWAAYGTMVLHNSAGALGVTFVLVPVALVHLFLVILGINIAADERRREAYARDRQGLLVRVRESSEAERNRIGRDLHDGVLQELSALRGGLDLDGAQGVDVATRTSVDRARRALDDIMANLRDLARDLTPPTLLADGFSTALAEMVGPLREEGLTVSIDVALDTERGPWIATAYRIAQEATRNIRKHAEARHVWITVSATAADLHMSIRDDGVGFDGADADRKRRDGHLGLQVLRDLAAIENGSVEITSEPGKGTNVVAQLAIRPTGVPGA